MKRIAVALLLVALVAALACSFSSFPLPPPPPFSGPLPEAHPPPEMTLQQLPTGVTHRSAAFAYQGGSWFDRRDFAMTAALVHHPRGDLLIDTGFGRAIDEDVGRMPWWFRATTSYQKLRTAADQLRAAGRSPAQLMAIILTHGHWDHASGVADLPGIPVWVGAGERSFIANSGWIGAVARAAGTERYHDVLFSGPPYLGFAHSHDVFGDGAVVLVPVPGHTPGSLIVFVTLPNGRRHAFVGDLVWQREGIELREQRPWPQRYLGDDNPAAVRDGILRVAALHARFPEITIVPAHDARAFADLPPLVPAPVPAPAPAADP